MITDTQRKKYLNLITFSILTFPSKILHTVMLFTLILYGFAKMIFKQSLSSFHTIHSLGIPLILPVNTVIGIFWVHENTYPSLGTK